MSKENGGPAFPVDTQTARAWACFENANKPLGDAEYQALIEQLQTGMTLRDYFATTAPTDEVKELQFRHLSRIAQEQMAGMKHPEEPVYREHDPAHIAWQIAMFEFKCAVNAAIRYKLADAMIAERNKP